MHAESQIASFEPTAVPQRPNKQHSSLRLSKSGEKYRNKRKIKVILRGSKGKTGDKTYSLQRGYQLRQNQNTEKLNISVDN